MHNKKEFLTLDDQIKDAKDTLSRIIGFVCNCDQKSGMLLAVSGVIFLVLGNRGAFEAINLIETHYDGSAIFVILFTVPIVLGLFFYFFAVYTLSRAISANVVCSGKNLRTYFGDIQCCDFLSFKEQFTQCSKEAVLDDLLAQIYVNSIICTKKYRTYNCALNYMRYAIASLVVSAFLGFCFF